MSPSLPSAPPRTKPSTSPTTTTTLLLPRQSSAMPPLSIRPHLRLPLSPPPLLLLCLLKFSMIFTTTLMMLPLVRLMEDAVCHQVLGIPGHEMIEEGRCKGEEVQRGLAYLQGVFQMVEGVVGVVGAMPYGILADSLGRRPALLSSWLSSLLNFLTLLLVLRFSSTPTPLLATPLFQLLGGGLPVSFSAIYAVASDITSESDRASSFFCLTIAATLGGISGPPVASVVMESIGPWGVAWVVSVLAPGVLGVILALPETLPWRPDAPAPPKDFRGFLVVFKDAARASIGDLAPSFSLLTDCNVLCTMVAFVFQNPLYLAYSTMMIQYISKNFAWSIASTSWLLAPLGLLNIACLLLLPTLSRHLTAPTGRFRWSPFTKDKNLTRITITLVIIGALLEGLTASLPPFLLGLFIGTFGSSNNPLARALATHFVPPDKTSRLMALIGIVETIGSFMGGPVLAFWFDLGMKGWVPRGAMYLYIAFLCALAVWAIGYVTEPPKRTEAPDGDTEAVPGDGEDEAEALMTYPDDRA